MAKNTRTRYFVVQGQSGSLMLVPPETSSATCCDIQARGALQLSIMLDCQLLEWEYGRL